MADVNNFGHRGGRLTRDPVFLNNRDGSQRVYCTIALERGGRTHFIEVTAFLTAAQKATSPWNRIHEGDLVGFMDHMESSEYIDKNGQKQYTQELVVDEIDFREPLSVVQARYQAKHQGQAQQSSQPMQQDQQTNPFAQQAPAQNAQQPQQANPFAQAQGQQNTQPQQNAQPAWLAQAPAPAQPAQQANPFAQQPQQPQQGQQTQPAPQGQSVSLGDILSGAATAPAPRSATPATQLPAYNPDQPAF